MHGRYVTGVSKGGFKVNFWSGNEGSFKKFSSFISEQMGGKELIPKN